ncbi:MAG: hypothetical protein FWG91_05660 [Lachnospiraceae bacterium]|nr:hypothetical protein [Lachnospiraceae bacterium]
MATILRDSDFEKLLGSVIKNGNKENIRPNSYIIRLGSKGEYLSTGREFELGEDRKKKGIILPPGHSIGVSSIEEIDFSKETINNLFPGKAFHGFLAPTTDLSREGVVVSSTQVDAGFCGSLSWTLTNTSSQECKYVYGEALFRLTIFKLDDDEIPQAFYSGYYQGQKGYVRSSRKGAPVGMRESEWEEPYLDDGPEESLERLMKAGYPWQAVAMKLTEIDNQSKLVSQEYREIKKTMDSFEGEIGNIGNTINNSIKEALNDGTLNNLIRSVVSEEIPQLYSWTLIKAISALLILSGLIISIISTQSILDFVTRHGAIIGLIVIIIGTTIMALRNRPKRRNKSK